MIVKLDRVCLYAIHVSTTLTSLQLEDQHVSQLGFVVCWRSDLYTTQSSSLVSRGLRLADPSSQICSILTSASSWALRITRLFVRVVAVRMGESTLHGDFGYYACILVDVDMTSFLPNMLTLEVDGHYHEISMVYEKFLTFCTTCNNIGHLLANCRLFKRKSNTRAEDHSEIKDKPTKLIYVPKPSNQDNTKKVQSQQVPKSSKAVSFGKKTYSEIILEKRDKGKSKVTWDDCIDHETNSFDVDISKGLEINMTNSSTDDYDKQEMDLVNLLPNHYMKVILTLRRTCWLFWIVINL
ncbi:hypothetical protein FNV43_RR09796 [Rhamnella rubrinervis]|uniref:Uncharacterized protein n=1 Tax=Rhamnella rubrinervis TaxID=2594499 RepID=A0A8K0HAM1_9ROSA|nr:hypothetical protein FNV43_RR09796 [Rhamnella rubrinervis]